MNSIAAIQGSRTSGGKGSIWLSFFLSFLLLIQCGPVQMALPWVLPPWDHGQVEVEFLCMPYL